MWKENSTILAIAALLSIGLSFSFSGGEISLRLQKKIDAAIRSTYEVDNVKLKSITVPLDVNSATPADFTDNRLFEIHSGSNLIGYLYVGEAASMKRKFDYILMFHTDFTIKKSKVLIYREEHGKQIGSQRWLKQFIGLSFGDVLTYGDNIDAISGATISASNMTKAVGDVLKSIQILKEKEAIK
ncbi:MAG: FMN-binding protein [Maribacter sp.]|uniref:FMN-binding protein n=1 Tax=Maribacter sp. TaxID=1897614 RepID=UPI003297EB47